MISGNRITTYCAVEIRESASLSQEHREITDIILEILRALIGAIICYLLLSSGRDKVIRRQQGWLYLVVGFGLIFFGMVIDITDNFPVLDKYIIIGDTKYQAFIEKVIGYMLGFLLLAVGFWKWLPVVITLRKTEKALTEAHDLLELKVKERTAQLEKEIQERKQTEAEKDTLVVELRKTLNEIKTLRGILPLCSYCKRIRNDKGFWEQVDVYIHQHSDADISHSLCPDCMQKYYPDEFKDIHKEQLKTAQLDI